MLMHLIRISVLNMTLTLIMGSQIFSLPLTKTIYMVPESEIEIAAYEEFIELDRVYRKEKFVLGFGALVDLSFWFRFEYIHKGFYETNDNEVGDIFLLGNYYCGDFAFNRVHVVFFSELRFPVGKNAYTSSEHRNLSFGNYELTIGPLFQIDLLKNVFTHLSILYTFRENASEKFFAGFQADVSDEKTWDTFFGFNPKASESFFYKERLYNDYLSFTMALNTSYVYPLIPYIDVSFIKRIGSIDDSERINIKASEFDPVLFFSTGLRYFFNRDLFIGCYVVQAILQRKSFIQSIYAVEGSLQF